ncbi:aldo/keto reductase [Pseudonocardia sp. ICBG601]|uniref:aldo/keto reductase n=1 Tax=Pseudonocardia sp. ICBG601 TaxID=2846759 RepID=UPI001CF6BC4F|nr:aldo/keto reductase [Pseudonocardia sp. ICBG601]
MAARGNRDALHLATKVGAVPGREGLSPEEHRGGGAGLAAPPGHRPDRTCTTPTATTRRPRRRRPSTRSTHWSARGCVREIGASNFSPERLRSALEISARDGLTAFSAIQPHYNLMERDDFEAGRAPLAESEKLAVHPYFGLAKGFLTGKYRPGLPRAGGPAAPRARRVPGLPRPRRAGRARRDLRRLRRAGPGDRADLAGRTARGDRADRERAEPEQLEQLLPMLTLELTEDELRLLSYLSATS